MSKEQQQDGIEGVIYFHSETGTEGGYWAFQDKQFIFPPDDKVPSEHWSYDGLHILKDGDKLTIFEKEKPGNVAWEGVIELEQKPLFTEDAFGLWIHADQRGIGRERWANWFFENYPARLERVGHPGDAK